MPLAAPPKLVALLDRLRLASPAQITAAGSAARRLAAELPDFESVWIDALLRRRLVTAWQASEISAGRGDLLLRGPYRIEKPLPGPGYARCFRAVHLDRRHNVRLYLAGAMQRPLADTLEYLRRLTATEATGAASSGDLIDFGSGQSEVWAAYADTGGEPVSHWLAEHGRLPATAVQHIARAMVRQLAEMEPADRLHGDLSSRTLQVDRAGNVSFTARGLRTAIRHHEGYSFVDLPPEEFDYLAPERVSEAAGVDARTELFACGALWWHLATGRTPFAGGDGRAKLRSIHTGRTADVRHFCGDLSPALASVISDCLQPRREDRPASFAELKERLGAPTDSGRTQLAALLHGGGTWQRVQQGSVRRRSVPRWTMAAAVLAMLAAGIPLAKFAGREADAPEEMASLQNPVDSEVPAVDAVDSAPKSIPSLSSSVKVDPDVRPATATLTPRPKVEDLLLSTDGPLRVEQLDLQPGIRVRGRAGGRVHVMVPPRGLKIAADGVRFEGIDFEWRPTRDGSEGEAMFSCDQASLAFRNCTFSTRSRQAPAALRIGEIRNELPGIGAEVEFDRCVFDGLQGVVEASLSASLTVRMRNCLAIAAGPLLWRSTSKTAGEHDVLILDQVTTRGDTSIVEWHYGNQSAPAAELRIQASHCAFAASDTMGLITLVGTSRPEAFARAVHWGGQGSLVAPRTAVLAWQHGRSRPIGLPDEEADVAGLVRGAMEFARPSDGPPEHSLLLRWQAPLISAEPPGCNPKQLPIPPFRVQPRR